MRRFLILICALCVALGAAAQGATEAIVIDAATFRAVQSDALTGVNIDPIGVDLSRRPCARLKILFHRMTKEQIAQLEVRFRSNTDIRKQVVGDYENLLILEMTALKATRFYLHHPTFGDSNEVSFDLEGGREYQLEASLNKQYSFTILSNQAGAEVYIDGVFKGTTNSDKVCTITDLFQGEYNLRVVFGNNSTEQTIKVAEDSDNYAVANIDHQANVYQYLVINTTPSSALVEIDGKSIQRTNGKVQQRLLQGVHHYRVSADNYYTKSDTVVLAGNATRTIDVALDPAFGYLAVEHSSELQGAEVYVDNRLRGTLPLQKSVAIGSGEHVVRIVKAMYNQYDATVTIADNKTTTIKPTLAPNFAKVSVAVAENAEIWIDGEQCGASSWSGNLEIGKHTVDCRKASYEDAHYLLDITSTASVSREYPALKPIYGSLDISCNVDGAEVYVDDIKVGVVPMIKNDVLVGKRTVRVVKSGYDTFIQSVTVEKGKTVTLAPTLALATATPKVATATTTDASANVKKSRVGLFQVGIGLDYFIGSKNMAIGVPVDLRLGRCDQIFNGFIFGKYNHFNTEELKANDESIVTKINATQWSVGAKLRFNLKQISSIGALYTDIGAMYNFNTKATYTTNYIYSTTSSYEAGLTDNTTYNADILNKNSITPLLALGIGGSLCDLSICATYDAMPTFKGDALTESVVDHRSGSLPTTLADFPAVEKIVGSRFYIGFCLRAYFGSGFMKK
ncbi:MAG: PEGA domain-containing protein [Alistipes sp.]|nr:PEGA domain-containing protein [Alistipes sp.]